LNFLPNDVKESVSKSFIIPVEFQSYSPVVIKENFPTVHCRNLNFCVAKKHSADDIQKNSVLSVENRTGWVKPMHE
jgi:hypothetical protein